MRNKLQGKGLEYAIRPRCQFAAGSGINRQPGVPMLSGRIADYIGLLTTIKYLESPHEQTSLRSLRQP